MLHRNNTFCICKTAEGSVGWPSVLLFLDSIEGEARPLAGRFGAAEQRRHAFHRMECRQPWSRCWSLLSVYRHSEPM
jgi:hypothetical protein